MPSNELVEKAQRKIAKAKKEKLTSLDLRGCGLEELPESIFELTHLEVLNLSNTWQNAGEDRNRMETLPPEIALLKNLRELHIWDGRLKELPDELSKLTNLEELDISGNSFTYLPLVVTKITSLRKLDLRHNYIEILPLEITQLVNLENIYLRGNPLNVPPPELIEQGTSDVIEYLKSLKENPGFFYDAKVILVGEPEVGKTSLMQSLLDKDFDLDSQSVRKTEKINVRTLHIPREKTEFEQDFRLHIWDFAGDDIYHSTHRFFLTENSIYLLVLTADTPLHRVYYWLHTIETFGRNSPILLVHNKVDLPSHDFPVQEFKNEFKSIKGDLQLISCKFEKKHTVQSLESSIISLIKKLPQVENKSIPYTWVQVREDLKVEKNSYIAYKEYEGEICKKHGIDSNTADSMAGFFHNSGIFLHFEKDKTLRQKIFLDRDWIITGVYLIFKDKDIQKKEGRANDEDFQRIFANTVYRYEEDQIYITKIMESFKICFPIEGKEGSYILPRFLPRDAPKEIRSNSYKPQFEYKYDKFVPSGLLFEFMAKVYNKTLNGIIWRYGILCEIDGIPVLIREHTKNPKITINFQTEAVQKALLQVCEIFEEIHQGFASLPVEESVACVCNYCTVNETKTEPYFHNYRRLLQIAANYKEYAEDRCGESLEAIPVVSLIGKVSPKINEEIKKRGIKMSIRKVSPSEDNATLESDKEKKKIDAVRGIPEGPHMADFDVDSQIKEDFSKILYEKFLADDAINNANSLCKKASLHQNDISIIRTDNLPAFESSSIQFWNKAFKEACVCGPRMLFALLLQVPVSQLQSKEEYKKLLDILKNKNH